jgi:ParB-like chromosome segregation protein Spo0J
LRSNLERVGLLEPIIWNRRTGNVVGGHQRLAALDALEGSQDYLVPVAVVDLDEREEKAQNVFLNNGEAQGEWDMDLLGDLLRDIGQPDLAGFDYGDLYQLFGTDPVAAPADDRAAELFAAAQEARERFRAADRVGNDREAEHFYLVVVFPGDADRVTFTESLGLPDNRYVDGRHLQRLLTEKATGVQETG